MAINIDSRCQADADINRPAWIIFGTVGVLWIAWFLAAVAFLLAEESAKGGEFGDWFGSINALFTALAFGAVAWSALIQRKEMKLQREEMAMQRDVLLLQKNELALQRKALDDQREEMAEQRKVFAQQTFEATFFQMLAQCREELRKLDVSNAVGAIWGHVFDDYQRGNVVYKLECDLIGRLYEERVYARQSDVLGPYFRTLYHLFKLIDRQTTLDDQRRREYANIARAHLSGNIVFVLAVNGCSEFGKGFRPLIEKYGLLKHIEYPKESTAEFARRHVEPCYADFAFRGADEQPSGAALAERF